MWHVHIIHLVDPSLTQVILLRKVTHGLFRDISYRIYQSVLCLRTSQNFTTHTWNITKFTHIFRVFLSHIFKNLTIAEQRYVQISDTEFQSNGTGSVENTYIRKFQHWADLYEFHNFVYSPEMYPHRKTKQMERLG